MNKNNFAYLALSAVACLGIIAAIIITQSGQAQSMNCPAGYTCTVMPPQPPTCPSGYVCIPLTSLVTTNSNTANTSNTNTTNTTNANALYGLSTNTAADTSANASTGSPKQYYFGGMYGDGDGSTGAANAANYTNPLAGNKKACPTGYKAHPVLGTLYVDYPLYVCIGTSDKVSKVAEFGGMFGTPNASYTNPLANNTRGCPTGYKGRIVYGSSPTNGQSLNIPSLPSIGSTPNLSSLSLPSLPTSLSSLPSPIDVANSIFGGNKNSIPPFPGDYFMGFCYGPTTAAPVVSAFDGVWSNTFNNPVTGAKSCPAGSKPKTIFGAQLTDFAVTFCYVPLGSGSTGSTDTTGTSGSVTTGTGSGTNTSGSSSGSTGSTATCNSSSPSAPIFVVMGQSNAAGVGQISQLSTTQGLTNIINALASSNWPFKYWYNDTQSAWRPGSAVKTIQGNYFGPDLVISYLLDTNGLSDFYTFKYAVSGTSLATDWGSRGTGGYYDKAVASLKKSEKAICATGKNPVVKAVFWMQGESDASDATMAASYGNNLTRLISQSRQDYLGATSPFIIGLIDNYVPGLWPYADEVRNQQKSVAAKAVRAAYVETNDLQIYNSPCTSSPECVDHYNTLGQYGLGTRFYNKYASM